ncbi:MULTISPECIES: small acid-soluble spore protein Tlp [Paraliobacillus]|uniref:small acid-soluble spore protein Tlp n=1 Tax=Paraliobacillus TaxID=200903 RepID=UPI000DD454A5|nr:MULTISPECIES: small acid-soluble spore protein Tlp [Paraliobacillus]
MSENKPNPDNRADNVEKLQEMVHNTIENIEQSHDALQHATDQEKENIEAKNERREESLEAIRVEIKDEYKNQQK